MSEEVTYPMLQKIIPVNKSISYNGGTDVDDSQDDGGHVWVDARAGLFEDRYRVKHNSVDATKLEKKEKRDILYAVRFHYHYLLLKRSLDSNFSGELLTRPLLKFVRRPFFTTTIMSIEIP